MAPARVILLLVCVVAVTGCGRTRDLDARRTRTECRVRVAAYDVGSATTKLQVAEVDVCRGIIAERLLHATEPVPYGADIARTGAFEPHTIERGIDALSRLQNLSAVHAPDRAIAVATEAFRHAGNRHELLGAVRERTGLQIEIITQRDEGALAFFGAIGIRNIDAERAVVWDVGGESMQLTALIEGELFVHGVDFATNDMRRHFSDAVEGGRAYARDHALGEIPSWLLRRLEEEHTIVIGVGAWRYFPGDEQALDKVQSQRPEHESTVLLLLGVMDALSLRVIEPAAVDLTDGLLVPCDKHVKFVQEPLLCNRGPIGSPNVTR